jgi:hypothetical protein
MKTAQEQKELIDNHPTVQMFHEIFKTKSFSQFYICGGAITDLLEGREPKDWDFLKTSPKPFLDAGFEHVHTTKSAATYKKDGITVQILSKPKEKFDFTISQATYEVGKKILSIDEQSFKDKTLTPVSFETKSDALCSLLRIPHWKKKGYTIHDLTYLSLLNVVAKNNKINS